VTKNPGANFFQTGQRSWLTECHKETRQQYGQTALMSEAITDELQGQLSDPASLRGAESLSTRQKVGLWIGAKAMLWQLRTFDAPGLRRLFEQNLRIAVS